MGKNQSEQPLARRNSVDVVRGGSAGTASHPPTAIAEPTDAATTPPIDTEDNDTGRESVRGEPEITDVIVELPTVTPPAGYVSRRVDATLTGEQAIRLKSINYGLQARNATLKNGTIVKTNGHVLAWILEQV